MKDYRIYAVHPAPRPRGAFTLVELLAAMVLASVALAAALSVIALLARDRARLERAITTTDAGLLRLVRDDLEAAAAARFNNDRSLLELRGPLSRDVHGRSTQREAIVLYSVTHPEKNAPAALVRWQRLTTNETGDAGSVENLKPVVVAVGIVDLRIAAANETAVGALDSARPAIDLLFDWKTGGRSRLPVAPHLAGELAAQTSGGGTP